MIVHNLFFADRTMVLIGTHSTYNTGLIINLMLYGAPGCVVENLQLDFRMRITNTSWAVRS
jgi:hypothetical protein